MQTCLRCGSASATADGTCGRCHAPLGRRITARHGTPTPAQDAPGSSGLVLEPWLWQQSQIGRRAPKSGPIKDQHYLVPPFGDPLRLEATTGTAIVLGRDESCTLRIASPTVSRRHAEILFRGKPARAFVKDLGTVNGTRLNGAIVRGERTLEDRDVLRLGDVTAHYRVLRPGEALHAIVEPRPTSEKLNATIPLGTEGLAAVNGATGDVSFFPMEELLGRLTMLRASGRFVVDVDGSLGHIRFEDGRVVTARFGGREGDVAFKSMAQLRRGKFRFDVEEPHGATP